METYITLVRSVSSISENACIGHLYINGEFFCTTLENLRKSIPLGLYSLSLTYSPRFKKYLPLISGVPHRIGIRIHSGNTSKDSQGCVLVGVRNDFYTIKNSRSTLFDLISELFSDYNTSKKYKFEVK